jgi:hypothetical protein
MLVMLIISWGVTFWLLVFAVPNVFGSKATVARNARIIGTDNVTVARIACIVGTLIGLGLGAISVWLTGRAYKINPIVNIGGLVAALFFFLFTYRALTRRQASAEAGKAQVPVPTGTPVQVKGSSGPPVGKPIHRESKQDFGFMLRLLFAGSMNLLLWHLFLAGHHYERNTLLWVGGPIAGITLLIMVKAWFRAISTFRGVDMILAAVACYVPAWVLGKLWLPALRGY